MRARLAAAVTVSVVVLLSMSGEASAKAVKAKAPLENAAGCAVSSEPGISVGTATLSRTGEAVTLKVTMKAGLPNATYNVALVHQLPNGTCEGPVVATFTTNKKGKGKATATENRPLSETKFVVMVFAFGPESRVDTTPLISLP